MYFAGKRPSYPTSKFKWPHQSKPSNAAWKTWHKIVRTILHIPKNGILPPHHTLHQWLPTNNNRHMKHEWYHDTKGEELFRNQNNEICQYFSNEITYHTLRCNLDSCIRTNTIPFSATPTKESNNIFQCYPQFDMTIVPTKTPMSFKIHIQNLPTWKYILIRSGKETQANESLLELLQTKQTIIIASDGSKSATKSGGAWVFTNSKGTILIEGHNPDFGTIKEIHSHRAEVFGLLAALLFLDEYCRYYFIQCYYQIHYYCNNLEVVNKIKAI